MKYEYSIQYTHIFFILFFLFDIYLINILHFPIIIILAIILLIFFTQQIYCAKDLRNPPILHTNI